MKLELQIYINGVTYRFFLGVRLHSLSFLLDIFRNTRRSFLKHISDFFFINIPPNDYPQNTSVMIGVARVKHKL